MLKFMEMLYKLIGVGLVAVIVIGLAIMHTLLWSVVLQHPPIINYLSGVFTL